MSAGEIDPLNPDHGPGQQVWLDWGEILVAETEMFQLQLSPGLDNGLQEGLHLRLAPGSNPQPPILHSERDGVSLLQITELTTCSADMFLLLYLYSEYLESQRII